MPPVVTALYSYIVVRRLIGYWYAWTVGLIAPTCPLAKPRNNL